MNERRNFIRLVGGGLVVSATAGVTTGCSSAYPLKSVEAWNGPSQTESDPRRWALAYAITAPNPHNFQPWLVDLREQSAITIYTDPERILPETDPFGRQILIGHGAFLELLVIALAEKGLRATVALWPQGELSSDPKNWRVEANKPIARIALQANASRNELFGFILNRHTPKTKFDITKPVAANELAQILASQTSSGIIIDGTVNEPKVVAMRELCMESAKVEFKTARTMMESTRLMRVGPDEITKNPDGITLMSPFVRGMAAIGLFDRTKPPAEGSAALKGALERYKETTDTAMGFVWLIGGNSRSDQINAGRTYLRMQLKATSLGVGMHPLSQSLQEFPEMQSFYEKAHQLALGKSAPRTALDPTVQMLCRIGYLPGKEYAPATPRRELPAFIKA